MAWEGLLGVCVSAGMPAGGGCAGCGARGVRRVRGLRVADVERGEGTHVEQRQVLEYVVRAQGNGAAGDRRGIETGARVVSTA